LLNILLFITGLELAWVWNRSSIKVRMMQKKLTMTVMLVEVIIMRPLTMRVMIDEIRVMETLIMRVMIVRVMVIVRDSAGFKNKLM
jgi:hypothetical protein